MKKLLALALAAVLLLGLAACAAKTTTAASSSAASAAPAASASAAASSAAASASASASAASSAAASASASSGKVYNVCNLVNGNLGDKSFFDSAEAGLAKLQDDGRITYTTIEMGGTDEDQPKWLSTLYDVSESGEYDLIICGTYQMPDFLKEVATKYPDQKYLIYDDTTYVGANQNVVNMSFRQNDTGYLVGVFAASLTTDTSVKNINADPVLGFVGGVDSPVINDFLLGFIEGAQSVNKDIKVDTRYTNDYVNTAIAKEYGLSMINDNKCDIIWGVAGNAGNGACEAAMESGKAWFIGVDSDQEQTLSADLAAVTLTSGLKNVGNSLIWFFDQWDAGKTYWGQEINLGLKEGGVGIVTDKNFAKIAPKATQDAVTAAQQGIIDGTITVDSAIKDTTKKAETLRDAVKPK
jgi:basic membrane protein A